MSSRSSRTLFGIFEVRPGLVRMRATARIRLSDDHDMRKGGRRSIYVNDEGVGRTFPSHFLRRSRYPRKRLHVYRVLQKKP